MLCPTYISQFSLFGWLVPAGVDLFATPSQGDREGRALAVKGGKHRVGLLLQAGRHHFVEGSVIFDDKNRKHRAMTFHSLWRITLLRPSLQGPFLAGSKILSPPGERSGTIVTSDGHRYAEMQKLSLAIFIKTKLSLLFIYDLFMTAAGCACWRRSGRPWTRCAGAVHRPRESG